MDGILATHSQLLWKGVQMEYNIAKVPAMGTGSRKADQ
jgi:hypothetical protein